MKMGFRLKTNKTTKQTQTTTETTQTPSPLPDCCVLQNKFLARKMKHCMSCEQTFRGQNPIVLVAFSILSRLGIEHGSNTCQCHFGCICLSSM